MPVLRTSKSSYFQFRILPEEKERLYSAVRKMKYFTVAAFVREAILEKVKKVEHAKH